MAFVNLPPNLQDIFKSITDRIAKLETGPNQAMYTAEAAQQSSAQGIAQAQAAYALGVQAQNEATQALIAAQAAYALGSQSLIKSANTITNAQNQITGINGNGITVYSGTSSTSGARVVLNSAGLAGYNSSNTATFAIDASTGAVSTLGAIFTNSSISGGSLNINGNAIINSSGFLTAYGATINGTITSNAATITGGSLTVGPSFQVTTAGILTASNANITGTITANSGTIGGWSIASGRLFSGASEMNASTGSANFTSVTTGGVTSSAAINTTSGAAINSGGNITAVGSATFGQAAGLFEFLSSSGNVRVSATYGQVASGRAMQVTSAGLYGTASSTERRKHNIRPHAINAQALLQLEPVAFNYLKLLDEEQNPEYGFLAEDADRLGLFELVGYDKDGLPDYFAYEKLPTFLLQIIKNQEARINALEGN
jgi:hypothetical protein